MTSERPVKPWIRGPQQTYVFKNANVVDTVSGTTLSNRTAKISKGLIESVTHTDNEYYMIPSSNEITIDLKGKYICPSLFDNHVHLWAVPGEATLGGMYQLDNEVVMSRQPFVCQQMLRRGFTSVRDCGGANLALKQAINDGVIQGPQLFIAGHALSQTGGHGDLRGAYDHSECCGPVALGWVCDGVPACIKAAREELRTGADFIKIMAGGGVASPTDKLENVQFTGDEVRAISEVARNANTYVTAHAYTSRSIRHAVDKGVTSIEHGNSIDEETAAYMAERDVFLTPTLIMYSAMASPEFPGFLPVESEAKNAQVLKLGLRSLQIASKAGVTICFGTDLLGPMGVVQTKEFALRAQVLSNKDVLQSATLNPARRAGMSDFLGQIKEGFAADLLILNENPLQDVSIFDKLESHMLAVVEEGRVCHSRWSELPQDAVQEDRSIE